MYAELKRKVCKYCGKNKSVSKFSGFRKGNKKYPRPFCIECKGIGNFEWDLWKNYRIRLPEYLEMYRIQNGCCACCGAHEAKFKRKLHVDHNAETKEVRALLCTQCNPGIGYFKHSIERLELAIRYLKKFKK